MAAPPKAFHRLLTPDQARAAYASVLQSKPRGIETVPLIAALGRVLAADVAASTDLPPFERSAVDGWAVRAADLADAAADHPVVLRRLGEVYMGAQARVEVALGGAVRIPTGGEIPPGADAVLMQEYADVGGEGVAARRAVRVGENVVERGIDVREGQVILRRGRRLRAADLGILAGMGMAEVGVFFLPRVAIMATGDEVVSPDAPLGPGQVRDMNSPALAGAVLAAGGSPVLLGIVPDDRQAVDTALGRALAGHEMVLVSGGSSVGERDVVADAMSAVGPPGIVVHGIAVRPGKPTVLAAAGEIPVIGLPGNPVSALVIFDIFARPVLEALAGMDAASRTWDRVRARAETALPAAGAREDHRRVRLEARSDGLWAVPLPAGSQILTSLAQADGIVVVPPAGPGFARGEEVEVRLL